MKECKKGVKDYHIVVISYTQTRYTVKAKSLGEAEKRYYNGEYDDCYVGGSMDGEIVNEEWEEEED